MKDSHAALSNAFWAGVAGVILVLGGWSAWVTRAPRHIRLPASRQGEAIARAKGFLMVSSSPLTRSSYHAGDDFRRMRDAREAKLAGAAVSQD